jgi:hypothetical protein
VALRALADPSLRGRERPRHGKEKFTNKMIQRGTLTHISTYAESMLGYVILLEWMNRAEKGNKQLVYHSYRSNVQQDRMIQQATSDAIVAVLSRR